MIRAILRLILMLCLCAAGPLAFAADVQVTASVEPASIEPGEQAQYQISVQGGDRVTDPPSQIAVEGLDINYVGPQRTNQISIVNGRMTRFSGIIFQYMVSPRKTGSITIPAQTITVDGRSYKTNPVTLNVEGNGQQAVSAGDIRSAEIVLAKDSAYVGEAIPLEIRVYLDTRMNWRLLSPPTLTGEGFTTKKMGDPIQGRETRNGREYHRIVFSTAITPAKTGDLKIGPLDMKLGMRAPQRNKRGRDPFGGFEDFFNMPDPFGGGNWGPEQEVQVGGEPATLHVKSLPQQGRPASFDGAIGDFTMESDASPLRVKVGDPITLRIAISGRGDFDRVNAPRLINERGWHDYKPSAQFKADDNLGLSGRKQFEMAVVPEEPKSKLPHVEFSFFDPAKEKYVTLTAEQKPIEVEGVANAPAQTTPSAGGTPSVSPQATASATPQPSIAPKDILYIRTDSTGWGGALKPLYARRDFWLWQAIPLGLLIAAGLGIGMMRRRSDAHHVEAARWRKERAGYRHTVERASSRTELLDAAARVLQGDAALGTGRTPASLHAAEVCAARRVPAEVRTQIESIFASREELQYAGRSAGAEPVSMNERETVLHTLKQYENSPRV